MKCLVFGFSVTGENDGLVERCDNLCSEHAVFKLAIGGLQPDKSWHLIPSIVRRIRPDALVIEEATAVYRLRSENPDLSANHIAAMEYIFQVCNECGTRVGFLDLPLTGVESGTDWLLGLHAHLSRKYSVPHVFLPLDESLLRDIVHTNEEGKDRYAAALKTLINEIAADPPDFSTLVARRGFEAYSMEDVEISGGSFDEFSRTGLTVKLLELPEDLTLDVALPDTVAISGFIMTMGPTTGDLAFDFGDRQARLHCYDRHCYYQRLSGKSVPLVEAGAFSVRQDSTVPLDQLVKGEKNMGSRKGGLAYVLYQTKLER